MATTKPQSTPMVANTKLHASGTAHFHDPRLYRSTIGALQYLCVTRPDIAFSMHKLSQFIHCRLDDHWQAVKRVLRYLQGTRDLGLRLRACYAFHVSAMSDVDWASDINDWRSTSSFCVFFGENLVLQSSKKQPIVSRSSTKAEYRALALTVTEVTWLQYLLSELRIPVSNSPPMLYCDNMSFILF